MSTKKDIFLFLIPGIILPIVLYFLFPDWTVDDAYITFRYGKNLIEHGQLVWNPGLEPVEGFTGIFLPLVSAGFLWLGWDPAIATDILSLIFLLSANLSIYLLFKRMNAPGVVAFTVVLLVGISPILYTHLHSGLETVIYGSSLVIVTYLYIRTLPHRKGPQHREWSFFFSLFLISLMRPEGAALAIVMSGTFFLRRLKRPETRQWSTLLRASIALFIPGLVFFGWRAIFYGSLLPNTFYAKAYNGLVNPESIKHFLLFCINYLVIPFAILVLLIATNLKKNMILIRERLETFSFWIAPLFISILASLFVYLRSNLYMGFSFRFFFPMLPLLLIIIGIISLPVVKEVSTQSRSLKLNFLYLILFLIAGQALLNGVMFTKEASFVRQYDAIMQNEWLPVANFINQNLRAEESISCYQDAGLIPYITNRQTWDFGRLNDKYLAKTSLDNGQVADYFFKAHAGAAIFTSHTNDKYSYFDEGEFIQSDSRFSEYELVKIFGTKERPSYYQFVYFRKDLLPISKN